MIDTLNITYPIAPCPFSACRPAFSTASRLPIFLSLDLIDDETVTQTPLIKDQRRSKMM